MGFAGPSADGGGEPAPSVEPDAFDPEASVIVDGFGRVTDRASAPSHHTKCMDQRPHTRRDVVDDAAELGNRVLGDEGAHQHGSELMGAAGPSWDGSQFEPLAGWSRDDDERMISIWSR